MPFMHHCPKCSRKLFTLNKLISHIELVHGNEPHFSITCGLDGCQRSFEKFQSYRKHVYRSHKSTYFGSRPSASEDPTEPQHHVHVDQQSLENEPEPSASYESDNKPNIDKLLEDFGDYLFGFILKCREKKPSKFVSPTRHYKWCQISLFFFQRKLRFVYFL